MTREEAIKVVKSATVYTPEEMEALETLIPELRESEDERIRKGIVETIKQCPDTFLNPKNRKEMLAYLERQLMSAEEILTRAGLKPFKDGNQWSILAGDNIQEGICGFGDTIEEALQQFLMEVREEQKKQKSAEMDQLQADFRNINEAFEDGKKEVVEHPERYGLCKPAGWSEGDENALKYIHELIEFGYSKNFMDAQTAADMRKWINKSFRPQSKQEWSKEDDLYLIKAINIVAGDFGEDCDLARWLNALPGRIKLQPQQERPEVDLEKAARHVYESWMGSTMDDFRRDMDELGKVLNARKEESK